MLDLQQEHTGMVNELQIVQRVRATVVSFYPKRGANGEDEALIDAGAIAFSKDGGPSSGYGRVVGKPWRLVRMSQEHGILTRSQESGPGLELGETVDIVGQHACLIAAVSLKSKTRKDIRICRHIHGTTLLTRMWTVGKRW